MGENKTKCNFKCLTCHNYDKEIDFCYEKNISDCSKQLKTDFSKCNDYLIREELIMFNRRKDNG